MQIFYKTNPTDPFYIDKYVKKIIRQAATIAMKNFNGEQLNGPVSGVNLPYFATKVDQQVDDFLVAQLKRYFPSFAFITEEKVNTVKFNNHSEYVWIIDPIDGTLNFANKIPLFAISIALWKDNKPYYAAVSLPIQGDLITATLNSGTYLNEKRFLASEHELSKPYIVYAHIGSTEERLRLHKILLEYDDFPRFLGSGVYQTIMACLRKADVAIFINTAIWDIGATVLIAKEAGLYVEWLSPQPDLKKPSPSLTQYVHSVIIGEKKLSKEIAEKVKKQFKL